MRCRYCGNVFLETDALGSAEFCMEEHRQKYEERLQRLGNGQRTEWKYRPTLPADVTELYPAEGGYIPCEPVRNGRHTVGYGPEAWNNGNGLQIPEAAIALANGDFPEHPLDGPLRMVALLGIYPYAIHNLKPVGEIDRPVRYMPRRRIIPDGYFPRRALIRAADANGSVRRKTKGFPSGTPKGFTSELPITKVKPSFKSLTGEYSMPEKPKRTPSQKGPGSLMSGPPNMQLAVVRQVAVHLAEKHWQEAAKPRAHAEPIEFQPGIEWAAPTKLQLDASGFHFAGEPEDAVLRRTPPADGPIVNVAALLAEPEEDTRRPAVTFEPIVWDELDGEVVTPPSPAPSRLAVQWEIYEPPVEDSGKSAPAPDPPVAQPPAEAVVEAAAEVEEEPYYELEMADAPQPPRPNLRPPAPYKPQPVLEPLASGPARTQLPTLTVQPLRAPMALGPLPAALAPKPEPRPEPPAPPAVAELSTATAAVAEEPGTIPEAAAAPPAEALRRDPRRPKKLRRQPVRREADDLHIEEPSGLGEEIEAELAAQAIAAQEAATPAPPEPPVQAKPRIEPPAENPKPAPVAEVSFGGLANAEPPPTETVGLGLSAANADPVPVTGMGAGAKTAIAVVVLAIAGGVGYWQLGGSGSKAPERGALTGIAVSGVETAGTVMGEAGWTTDFATDERGRRLRQLSFYRPSMQIVDYRVEFVAEIDYKAVSWVVRAANTKNYYVLKIAQYKGGADPDIRFVRFPVVNGQPGQVKEMPLPFPARLGMSYRVQTDVVGDKFSVRIQDKVVEEWTDSALLTGGFGVANEGAERGQVRTIQMWHLRSRTK